MGGADTGTCCAVQRRPEVDDRTSFTVYATCRPPTSPPSIARRRQHRNVNGVPTRTVLTNTADVYCDGSGRVGVLSYLVPEGMDVAVGDAVDVPFGATTRRGVVVGPGDPGRATRPISCVHGPRTTSHEIGLAVDVAAFHAVPFSQVAPRLAPRSRRGNPPLEAGDVRLVDGPSADDFGVPPPDVDRVLWAVAPAVPLERVTALEVERFAAARPGQVLVLCPTKRRITATLAQFVSGAARLDVMPAPDGPSPWRGMVDGTLRVGIASRAAALWSVSSLAGIVVVDEAHPGHVEASQPRTNAVTLAAERAAAANVPLSVVSTVPSLTALGSKVKCLPFGSKQHFGRTSLIDRTVAPPSERAFPPELAARLRAASKVLVVASTTIERFRCDSCDGRLVDDAVCPDCGSSTRRTSWDPVGLAERFAARGVPSASCAFTELLADDRVRSTPSTVVLFDFDRLVTRPELHPLTTAARVLAAAVRRATPDGEVLLCTSDPSSEVIRHLVRRRDLVSFAKHQWEHARRERLPPFTRLLTLRTRRAAAPQKPAVGRVLGPRRRSDGEWEVMVLFADDDLDDIHTYIARVQRGGKVRYTLT